ncbi:DUF2267 domain-containing protein [Cognatiyoonia sp. IB215182]|uniref:DUF2267 domain-containing protein n=1 Tax=Cognatiyoonia sp. IB215182 TaxID=3097353 RepID=UPI002A136E81|nr:DUF2267 domain-containing protein [Cognatiyoonia sp. IB215182]MDX8354953.1 DUF2267 domain-containing protein [Cognatiyoonia sp. IB215182]
MTRMIHVFERTTHEAHEWVNDLAGRTGWSNEREVLRLLRTVLVNIRDHLPVNEMAQFSAQLPLILRGTFYEGWQPKKTPVRERHAADFIAAVEAQVGEVLDYRGESDIKAVFNVINARISRGEVEDVRACLPQELRDMWPAP